MRYTDAVSQTPIHELNDRTRMIFRMVVESYLDNGAPVGSRTVSKFAGLNLSPASIRNVMQDLEEAGYLASPHTSAGRVPTESGLRLFVDGMMQSAAPSVEEQRAIESQIRGDGPIEEALAAATSVLSGLSACAGIVLVPKRDAVLKALALRACPHPKCSRSWSGPTTALKTGWCRLTQRSASPCWWRLRIIFRRACRV